MQYRPLERVLLGAILALSLGLNTWNLAAGQPRHWDEAVDTLHPVFSLDALDHAFGGRADWSIKYPRFFYVVTGAVERVALAVRYGPAEAGRIHEELLAHHAASVGRLSGEELRESFRRWAEPIGTMIVAGRAVSAVMGTLLVLATFLFAGALFGAVPGLVASALVAVSYPFVYYAHTVNVDVPYLCLGVFALHAAVRAVRTGTTRQLIAAGLLAALAVATKDQAYGMFLLAAPLVLLLMARNGRPVPWRGLALAAAAAVLAYLLLIGVPYDLPDVRRHFDHVFGAGVEPFRQTESAWTLLVETAGHLHDALGGLPLLLAAIGTVLAFRRAGRAAWLLIAPALSMYLTFIAPIGYCYLRFTMPILLVLLIAAALPIAGLLGARGWRWAGFVLFAAAFLPAALRSIEVNRMLGADTRLRAQGWMDAHVAAGEGVAMYRETPQHNVELPRHARVAALTLDMQRLPEGFGVPDVVVLSAFDPLRAGSGRVEALPPAAARRRFFGHDYALEAVIEPLFEHPIRRGVAFQPTIVAYRRVAHEAGE
jgi:hypothetical protein